MHKRKLFLFILLFSLISISFGYFVCGQDTENCVQSLSIDTMASYSTQKLIENKELLKECAQCYTGVQGTEDMCKVLMPRTDYVKTCQRYSRSFNDLKRLLEGHDASPLQIQRCQEQLPGSTPETCQLLVRALRTADSSFCKGLTEQRKTVCEALASGRGAVCQSEACEFTFAIIRALRSRRLSDCSAIKDPLVQAFCRGSLNRRGEDCERTEKVKKYKRIYCDEIKRNKEGQYE